MRVRMGALGISLSILSALVASSANTRTAEARSGALSVPTVGAPRAAPSSVRSPSAPAAASDDEAPSEVVQPPPADLRLENPKLRRLQKSEVTQAMLALAGDIVRRHHAKPVGTQIEVDVDGKHLVARIERHFHPEGGAVKPWGFHPGVSLFVPR